MKKINVEVQADEIIKALVEDGALLDEMPALRVGEDIIIDLDRLLKAEKHVIFKIHFGSYRYAGYSIDTQDKNNNPVLNFKRIAE